MTNMCMHTAVRLRQVSMGKCLKKAPLEHTKSRAGGKFAHCRISRLVIQADFICVHSRETLRRLLQTESAPVCATGDTHSIEQNRTMFAYWYGKETQIDIRIVCRSAELHNRNGSRSKKLWILGNGYTKATSKLRKIYLLCAGHMLRWQNGIWQPPETGHHTCPMELHTSLLWFICPPTFSPKATCFIPSLLTHQWSGKYRGKKVYYHTGSPNGIQRNTPHGRP